MGVWTWHNFVRNGPGRILGLSKWREMYADNNFMREIKFLTGKIKVPVSLRVASGSLVHGYRGVGVACCDSRRRCFAARCRRDSGSCSGASAVVRRRSLPLPWSCHGIDYLILNMDT
jgi:hypothetical protein